MVYLTMPGDLLNSYFLHPLISRLRALRCNICSKVTALEAGGCTRANGESAEVKGNTKMV